MRLPNITFYTFRQEKGRVLTINCIQGCTSRKFDTFRLKVCRERGLKGCGKENNGESCKGRFKLKIKNVAKEKMKCIENTFKMFECCVDLLNLDEKYPILQGKYASTKYIYIELLNSSSSIRKKYSKLRLGNPTPASL